MLIKFHQFLSKAKIAEPTIIAYKQDIEGFISFFFKRKLNAAQIDGNDIIEYINYLKQQGISTTYALRKLSVLKLFCKFLSLEFNHQDFSYIITSMEIPKFPLFCSKSQILQLLEKYKNGNDYFTLRNRLLISLLFNYDISIKQLSTLTFDNITDNNLKVLKNKKYEYYKINIQDIQLIEKYKKALVKHTAFNYKNYIFPINQSLSNEPIPIQALWSLLKKMFLDNTEIIDHNNFINFSKEVDIDIEALKIDYIKKHPRAL